MKLCYVDVRLRSVTTVLMVKGSFDVCLRSSLVVDNRI